MKIGNVIGTAKKKILVDISVYIDLMGERKLPHAQALLKAQKKGIMVQPIIDPDSHRIKSGISTFEELKARGINVNKK